MQEYNDIEKNSKVTNTWMKNPDGSKFGGTPEQFVQQSMNFNKLFLMVLKMFIEVNLVKLQMKLYALVYFRPKELLQETKS